MVVIDPLVHYVHSGGVLGPTQGNFLGSETSTV